MEPVIPKRLSTVDPTLIADHYHLEPCDTCLYIWEYPRHGGYKRGSTNSLILNFKRQPIIVAESPHEAAYKQRAIAHCAAALRALIEPPWFNHHATIVPIPPSKAPQHPDHDNRLLRTLALATQGYTADIRPLIAQTRSTCADHEGTTRQAMEQLRSITRINDHLASRPVRSTLIVFDDVLNSGKHFKVAQDLLHRRFPRSTILGVFLARCLPLRVDQQRGLPHHVE